MTTRGRKGLSSLLISRKSEWAHSEKKPNYEMRGKGMCVFLFWGKSEKNKIIIIEQRQGRRNSPSYYRTIRKRITPIEKEPLREKAWKWATGESRPA